MTVPEIRETMLPGVGVRHELTTERGERVVVLTHRSGRRELAVYSADDPDACTLALHLSPNDSRALVELLGASQVSEAVRAVQQQVEGLAIDWLTVRAGSPFVGSTIVDREVRSRTGATVVAVVRGDSTIPAPGPDLRFEEADVLVAVGTAEGLTTLRGLVEE
jgi:TrkA domain protein